MTTPRTIAEGDAGDARVHDRRDVIFQDRRELLPKRKRPLERPLHRGEEERAAGARRRRRRRRRRVPGRAEVGRGAREEIDAEPRGASGGRAEARTMSPVAGSTDASAPTAASSRSHPSAASRNPPGGMFSSSSSSRRGQRDLLSRGRRRSTPSATRRIASARRARDRARARAGLRRRPRG